MEFTKEKGTRQFKKFFSLKKDTFKHIQVCMIKGTLIASACFLSLVIPLTLPIFIPIALIAKNSSYMTIPLMIFEIKTIITFIVDA